jgi:hypothetical protein
MQINYILLYDSTHRKCVEMFQELTHLHQRMNIVYINMDLWAPRLLNYSLHFLLEGKRQENEVQTGVRE